MQTEKSMKVARGTRRRLRREAVNVVVHRYPELLGQDAEKPRSFAEVERMLAEDTKKYFVEHSFWMLTKLRVGL